MDNYRQNLWHFQSFIHAEPDTSNVQVQVVDTFTPVHIQLLMFLFIILMPLRMDSNIKTSFIL